AEALAHALDVRRELHAVDERLEFAALIIALEPPRVLPLKDALGLVLRLHEGPGDDHADDARERGGGDERPGPLLQGDGEPPCVHRDAGARGPRRGLGRRGGAFVYSVQQWRSPPLSSTGLRRRSERPHRYRRRPATG